VAAVNATTIPSARAFLDEYQKQFNTTVGSYSASGYASAMALMQAIVNAAKANGGKAPSREQVLEQLRTIKNFNSIIGNFSFDKNGDTTNKIISIWEAKNGAWKFVTQQNFSSVAP